MRRTCVQLDVRGLPPCAEPPFTLVGVMQGCDAPAWEILPQSGQRQLHLHLTLPVTCQVRDSQGCTYNARAVVELDAAVRLSFPMAECWRSTMIVLPCVRLVSIPTATCDTHFEAQLEILVELYLTRWEPCMAGVPKPVCPDLPLYPQLRGE